MSEPTVLVVDDAADIRLLLRVVLARAGFRVVEAAGGSEGLDMVATERPDAVLLDVQMPDADGWRALETIRGAPASADVPVILCTVKGRPEDLRRGWQLGCDGYLLKPFAITDVVDLVRTVMNRRIAQRMAVRRQALAEFDTFEGAQT